MKRVGRLVALALVLTLCPDNAQALVTNVTWLPSDPVMGEIVTYTAVNNYAHTISSYKWEFKFGTCGTWTTSIYTGSEAAWQEPYPGTWNIRLTVTYAEEPGVPDTPAPTVINKSVTIAPATHCVVTGVSVWTPIGTNIDVTFKLHAASRVCGPYIVGQPQQAIEDRIGRDPPLPPSWPPKPWAPDTYNMYFYLSENKIINSKSADWGNFPYIPMREPGTMGPAWFYKYKQKLRLTYTDPCGVVQYLPLGEISLIQERFDWDWWVRPQ